jgi:hypothetical protein
MRWCPFHKGALSLMLFLLLLLPRSLDVSLPQRTQGCASLRAAAVPSRRILLAGVTHTSNHRKAAIANSTWGRAVRERHAAGIDMMWFSNGAGAEPGFSPTVVPSLSGSHTYGDMTARVLGVLRHIAEAPGLLERYGWVARAWDDSWVSGGALLSEAQKFDPSSPLAVGLLGAFKGPELPYIMWGGGLLLLSRAALLALRGGGAEWCWEEVQRVTGQRGAGALPAEDVWVTKCLQQAGVAFRFGDGLFQGTPQTNGVLPAHPDWFACDRRLVMSSADTNTLLLEGDPGASGLAGVQPISFHYMTPDAMEQTYKAYYETPCPPGQHQRELDASGGWRTLPPAAGGAAPVLAAGAPAAAAGGACAPANPAGGGDLAIVIAARANAAHRHTAVYLSLGLTLRTVAKHYPRAALVVVDNAGGEDPSLAEFLAARAAARATLVNHTASAASGYEWGAYGAAARALGWAACLPYARVLFLQHTTALASPLPRALGAPCFLPAFHFPDLYDGQEQVDWVKRQLAALGAAPPANAEMPICGGAAGTNFLIGAPCLRAWLAAGAFDAVRVPGKLESMGTERLAPQLSRALCAGCTHCAREESIDGFHMPMICEDRVEDFVLGRGGDRYINRTFVKTVASGMCGGYKGEDLRAGGAWDALDAQL